MALSCLLAIYEYVLQISRAEGASRRLEEKEGGAEVEHHERNKWSWQLLAGVGEVAREQGTEIGRMGADLETCQKLCFEDCHSVAHCPRSANGNNCYLKDRQFLGSPEEKKDVQRTSGCSTQSYYYYDYYYYYGYCYYYYY